MLEQFPEVKWLTGSGSWPSISPDGSTVVYVDGSELWTVPIGGGDPTCIYASEGQIASRPDWSWSESIAFALQDGDAVTIWLIDGDGSNPRPFPNQGTLQHSIYPSWYRDLQSIVIDDVTNARFNHVYQIFASGTQQPVLLTPETGFCAGRPSVNPDGTAVAFAGRKGPFDQTNNQIWIVNTSTKELQQLDPLQGRSPNWSPDGRYILFESDRDTGSDGNYQLFVALAPGLSDVTMRPQPVTPRGIFASHGEWSRQQDVIVFDNAGEGAGIARIDVPEQFRG